MTADANDLQLDCQMKSLPAVANGPQEPVPIRKVPRLFVRKLLGPYYVKQVKKYTGRFLNWFARRRGRPTKPLSPPAQAAAEVLQAGDRVRVRPLDEVRTSLDHWGQLKGCSFAAEMAQYCNTTQTVLKPVERFMDERDFRIRRTRGIVLLEDIVCHGTPSMGRCDRNCYFFWREEWLEKV